MEYQIERTYEYMMCCSGECEYHGIRRSAGAQGEEDQRLAVRQAELELDQLLLVRAFLAHHRRQQNGLEPLQADTFDSEFSGLVMYVSAMKMSDENVLWVISVN